MGNEDRKRDIYFAYHALQGFRRALYCGHIMSFRSAGQIISRDNAHSLQSRRKLVSLYNLQCRRLAFLRYHGITWMEY